MFNLIKKPWVIVTAVFGVLLVVIKILLNKNKGLQSEALNSESDKKDAVLEERQNNLETQKKQVEADTDVEKKAKLTDKELEDYLKKI